MSQTSNSFTVLKILFFEKSILKFSLSAIIGLSFSVAVILCAIGLMDGFEFSLKNALNVSEGDIVVAKKNVFINDQELSELQGLSEVKKITGILQGQGFLLANDQSFGVMLTGINQASFEQVTNLKFRNLDQGIAIGKELAKKLNLKIGQNVTIVLAKGNQAISDQPLLESFKVVDIFEHNIYEKSLRYVFIDQIKLRTLLSKGQGYNQVKLVLKEDLSNQKDIEETVNKYQNDLGKEYSVSAYWHEFEILLEAVKVEKKTISLILQIIVLISLFNVVALFIYLTEKKSQEIFLLRALGINTKILTKALNWTALFIWFISCLISLFFKDFFAYVLKNVSWFKLPGEIYYLTGIDLDLRLMDYLVVFSISLCWLIVILFFINRRIAKENILTGLKKGN